MNATPSNQQIPPAGQGTDEDTEAKLAAIREAKLAAIRKVKKEHVEVPQGSTTIMNTCTDPILLDQNAHM